MSCLFSVSCVGFSFLQVAFEKLLEVSNHVGIRDTVSGDSWEWLCWRPFFEELSWVLTSLEMPGSS